MGTIAQQTGVEHLSPAAWRGFDLFMNETNDNDGTLEADEGAMCVVCHVVDWTPDPGNGALPDWAPAGLIPPMLTDFTYDNLGVPKNWDNPFPYQDPAFNPDGDDFVDLGLYRFLVDRPDLWPSDPGWSVDGEKGKFKVMTLRNLGGTPPYAHNGLFDTLREMTRFYNTRDALPACDGLVDRERGVSCWDAPEVPTTVNFDELGNLELSDADEDDLVASLMALSDGWGEKQFLPFVGGD